MKIKFVLGPYSYEVVLGNISEQVYNKYSQNNDTLKDAVSGIIYAISYKDKEKTLLSVESSNPNFQNFEVRMGDDV